ncbi:MAG: single-stranded DNA-binding protein [Bacillota bacterium]|nr:single-stranded DNA-binding protein [Bacillota bacterium]
MNKIFIIGNLTKDPEVRATGSGISVCTFTVAVQRRFQNAQGERQADFIPVVCWRGLADNCGKYLHKGSKVGVIGSVQTRSYDAADGSKRYVTEVVADEVEFLERPQHGETRAAFAGEAQEGDSPAEVEEGDMPF